VGGARRGFCEHRFPYDAEQDCFTCPAARKTFFADGSPGSWASVRAHLYRAPKEACRLVRCAVSVPAGANAGCGDASRGPKNLLQQLLSSQMSGAAQQIYAQRSQFAKFAHAWIKERCGLRQFRCRGRLKATMEATWAA